MKVYILNESDLEDLRKEIRLDPEKSPGSRVLSDVQKTFHDEAFRWYNYRIECWLNKIQKGNV